MKVWNPILYISESLYFDPTLSPSTQWYWNIWWHIGFKYDDIEMNSFAIIFGEFPISRAEVISSRVIRRYQFYKYFFIDFGKSVYCSRVFVDVKRLFRGYNLHHNQLGWPLRQLHDPIENLILGPGEEVKVEGGGAKIPVTYDFIYGFYMVLGNVI